MNSSEDAQARQQGNPAQEAIGSAPVQPCDAQEPMDVPLDSNAVTIIDKQDDELVSANKAPITSASKTSSARIASDCDMNEDCTLADQDVCGGKDMNQYTPNDLRPKLSKYQTRSFVEQSDDGLVVAASARVTHDTDSFTGKSNLFSSPPPRQGNLFDSPHPCLLEPDNPNVAGTDEADKNKSNKRKNLDSKDKTDNDKESPKQPNSTLNGVKKICIE